MFAVLIKLIKGYRQSLLAKHKFYTKLCDIFNIQEKNSRDDLGSKISSLLWQEIFSKNSLDSDLITAFETLYSEINKLFSGYSIWYCKGDLPSRFVYYKVSSNQIERDLVSLSRSGFMKLNKYGDAPSFCIKGKDIEIYVYPFLCIIKSGIEYNIVSMTNFNILDSGSINISERASHNIKGATPTGYYDYLYKRIDGGPDRRYHNNKSFPIFSYGLLSLTIDKAYRFIVSDKLVVSAILQSFLDYKDKYAQYLARTKYSVEQFDVTNDEYANLIHQLLTENGRDFIKSKKFIAILADYKIFKVKPYLRNILLELSNKLAWNYILNSNCSFNDLNQEKNNIVASNICNDNEATEAFAYIAYGLEIKS
jgi:hypothetical protein